LSSNSDARDRACGELLVALTPGLLTVGTQEIREPRSQVAPDVPDENRGGILPVVRVAQRKLLVVDLRERGIPERLVASELSGD
jgi:hypothetical protein